MTEPTDRAPPAPGKELIVGILLAVLLATLAIRNLVPAEALAPAIVTLLFAVGAAAAGAAWLCRARRFRIMWLDLAGSLTFIGDRHLGSDRAGSDGQAFHPLGST